MTITETIAHRIIDRQLSKQAEREATVLGELAAKCDIYAAFAQTELERTELELRAARYRDMQLAVLAEVAN